MRADIKARARARVYVCACVGAGEAVFEIVKRSRLSLELDPGEFHFAASDIQEPSLLHRETRNSVPDVSAQINQLRSHEVANRVAYAREFDRRGAE